MAEPCTIDNLPDSLLGHIMALVGRKHGLPLVSRRWKQLFYSVPELWRDVEVVARCCDTMPGQQRLEGQAALLRQVAPLVRRFSWDQNIKKDKDDKEVQGALEAAQVGLARCLVALQPGQLAELQLSDCISLQGSLGAALQQLTSIRSLQLQYCTEQVAATAVTAIGSRLCSLQLCMGSLTHAALDSIVRLTQLTALGIEAEDWPNVGSLTRLSQLKQLVLLLRASDQPTQLPPPASFSAGLKRFSFESHGYPFQIAGCKLGRCMVWHGKMDALCTCATETPLPTLALSCRHPIPSLARLLSALQPAGTPPFTFQRLELEGCLPQPHDVAACTQLCRLSELALKGVQPTVDSALGAGLAALLQQASQLSSLDIIGSRRPGGGAALGAVPACLASYRGLTSLSLPMHGLDELPPGEYLTGLRSLDLGGNRFTRVPAAISAATGLTSLSLSCSIHLSLCEADMETLLTLRHLQRLNLLLTKTVDFALLHRLPPDIVCSYCSI